MKYFSIILLFMFSCTQIDRVGDEKPPKKVVEEQSTIEKIDSFVTTKKEKPAEPKTVGYEYVDCGRTKGFWSQECVKRVNITTPNKFGITHIWIGYAAYQDSDILIAEWNMSTRIWVATKRDQDDVDFFYENGVDVDDLEEEKASLIKKTERKMQKYIKKALSKPLKNE